ARGTATLGKSRLTRPVACVRCAWPRRHRIERPPFALLRPIHRSQRDAAAETRPPARPPSREAGLERLGVNQHEHAPESVVLGDAVRQLEESSQTNPLA